MSNLNAFVNPVVRGVINPNKTIIYKKELHFDSRFRDNYGAPNTSAASFLYNLPEAIDNVVSLRLATIAVPSIPLTISESNGNNNLFINDILVTIPNGIYTIDELRNIINVTIATTPGLGAATITFDADPTNNQKTQINSNTLPRPSTGKSIVTTSNAPSADPTRSEP